METATGDTLIHCAVRKEYFKCVMVILGSLKNNSYCYEILCAKNHQGETALYLCKEVEMLKLLLNYLDHSSISLLISSVSNANRTVLQSSLHANNHALFRELLPRVQMQDKLRVLTVRDNTNGWGLLDSIIHLDSEYLLSLTHSRRSPTV